MTNEASITLYYGTNNNPFKLTPEKLFIVEDIEAYLTQRESVVVSHFQYQKVELTIEAKIDVSQVYANPLYDNGIKYVKIVNYDLNKPIYYYVSKAEWRARQSVKLYLNMDVLNTFKFGVDYVLSDKTKITRQHKDRFDYTIINAYVGLIYTDNFSTSDFNFIASRVGKKVVFKNQAEENFIAVIKEVKINTSGDDEFLDIYAYKEDGTSFTENEKHVVSGTFEIDDFNQQTIFIILDRGGFGIQEEQEIKTDFIRVIDYMAEQINPALYKTREYDINADNHNWYLIYINQFSPQDQPTINPVDCFICADEYLPFSIVNITGGKVTANNVESEYFYTSNFISPMSITFPNGDIWNPFPISAFLTHLCVYKTGNQVTLNLLRKSVITQNAGWEIYETRSVNYFEFSVNSLSYIKSREFNDLTGGTFGTWYKTASTQINISKIDDLDRTNAKLIKVIKLPYAPFKYDTTTPEAWEIKSFIQDTGTFTALKLKDINTKFKTEIEDTTNESILKWALIPSSVNIAYGTNRDDSNESKIYASEFTIAKLVYDSFVFEIDFEKINRNQFNALSYDTFKMDYVVTTTINSRFMFVIKQYTCGGFERQDYNNILCVTRNNEITLYNVAYINYIRNGYNYDVKAKQRSETSSILTTTLSLIGAMASFASSAVTGGAGVVMGISLATSAISGIYGTISSIKSNEDAMNAKITQLQNQSASVSGADDVDLLEEYSNNRAKICVYETTPKMKSAILDLFYYCGYAESIQEVPNVDSRYWFNYLSAEIEIAKYTNMSNEILEEMKNCYKAGVTFLHKHNNEWDIDQIKNNVENNLI